jgi:alkanesulfonate monooxygenase SsuD/methylene tetrahydromethanopterin reductase-like flavin-dependent oxidoreductase (luciferase family)
VNEHLAFGLVTTDQRWIDDQALRRLDESRFASLYVVDHPAFPIADPWTWLAWAAAGSRRIRLGTHVTAAPFHHPAQLARQVATVDVLSRGRAVLGIGTGYEHQDFEPYGHRRLPFGERLGQLDESLRILRSLWTEEKTQFHGLHYQLRGGAGFEPKPVQRPHPPVIVGLNRQGRLLRIAAERADGINTWQLGPEQIAELHPHMEAACRRAGRPPGSLDLSADVLLARGASPGDAKGLATAVRDLARSWGRDERVTNWDASGILHGDASEMAAQIERFREVGVGELSVSLHSLADAVFFDEEVIPLVA